MKVDWDELKQRHAEAKANKQMADEIFFLLMIDTFPAILAEREAAQRLRDEAAEMLKRVNANQSPIGMLTSDQWKPMAWLELRRAVQAFDKETQNEG